MVIGKKHINKELHKLTYGRRKHMIMHGAGIKPIGPIAPNWAPHWSYTLWTDQVHTTTHCRFYREQLDPALLRPALIMLCYSALNLFVRFSTF